MALVPTYYDTFALRPTSVLLERAGRGWPAALRRDAAFPAADPPFPVTSAFGGLAVYRWAVFDPLEPRHRRYAAGGPSECEHTVFHDQWRVAVNPGQVVLYGSDQSKRSWLRSLLTNL